MRQDSVWDLLQDRLSLHKSNGRVFENIAGRVSKNRILLADTTLLLSVGDRLTRQLTNGLIETFIVDDWQYQQAIDILPACFVVEVHRVSNADGNQPNEHTQPNKTGGSTDIAPQVAHQLVDGGIRRRRREKIQKYRKAEGIETMEQFAHQVGFSLTAIHGMVRGDRTRYSEGTLMGFLKAIGVFPEEW